MNSKSKVQKAHSTSIWVNDENGQRYQLGKQIGAGGTGSIFQTNVENKIIVLIPKRGSAKSVSRNKQIARLVFHRRLDICDLPITNPLSLIVDNEKFGYVMDGLSDMQPLRYWMECPTTSVIAWFLETGGVVRRLQILQTLASILSALHRRGLYYGDISDQKVYVSERNRRQDVRLCFSHCIGFDAVASSHICYTPGYGPPECVRQISGNSISGDVYSFAVLAYYLLTLTHPMVGDMVNNNEAWDLDSPDMMEKAYAGLLPWVNHYKDKRNKSSTGLPHHISVTNRLFELFRRTFEEGINHPVKRPTVDEWQIALKEAESELWYCQKCDALSMPYSGYSECPFCGQPK